MLNSVAKSKRADSLTYGLGRTGTGPGYILLAMKAQVLVQHPFLGREFTPERSSGTCMVTAMKAWGGGKKTPERSGGTCMAAAMKAQVKVQCPFGQGVLVKARGA